MNKDTVNNTEFKRHPAEYEKMPNHPQSSAASEVRLCCQIAPADSDQCCQTSPSRWPSRDRSDGGTATVGGSWLATEKSVHDLDFLEESDLKWLCGCDQSAETHQSVAGQTRAHEPAFRTDDPAYYVDARVADVDMDAFYREDMSKFLTCSASSFQMGQSSSQLFSYVKDVGSSINLSVDSLDSSLLESDRIAQSCCPNRENYTIAFTSSVYSGAPPLSVCKLPLTKSSFCCTNSTLNMSGYKSATRHLPAAEPAPTGLQCGADGTSEHGWELPQRGTHRTEASEQSGSPSPANSSGRPSAGSSCNNSCSSCQRDGGDNMCGSLLTKFIRLRLSRTSTEDAAEPPAPHEQLPFPTALHRTDNSPEACVLQNVGEVKLRFPRQASVCSVDKGKSDARVDLTHRMSLPLVDNSMQTSSTITTPQPDASRILYICYPQYSMPNLQFLSQSLEAQKNNVALCPVPLSSSKPLGSLNNRRGKHRPLSCNDVELFDRQRLSRVTDWSTLWPLLPESVHAALRTLHLPDESAQSDHKTLLRKINPTRFVKHYEHVRNNSIKQNYALNCIENIEMSKNYPLKDWLQQKIVDSSRNNKVRYCDQSSAETGVLPSKQSQLASEVYNNKSDGENTSRQLGPASSKGSVSEVADIAETRSSADAEDAAGSAASLPHNRQTFSNITTAIYNIIAVVERNCPETDDGRFDIDSVMLLKMCSCLHGLLAHGLRASQQCRSRLPFSTVWLLIETMADTLSGSCEVMSFVTALNSDGMLQDHTFKFCAFMSHLIETSALVQFLCALRDSRAVLRHFYAADALMFRARWAARREFDALMARLATLHVRHLQLRPPLLSATGGRTGGRGSSSAARTRPPVSRNSRPSTVHAPPPGGRYCRPEGEDLQNRPASSQCAEKHTIADICGKTQDSERDDAVAHYNRTRTKASCEDRTHLGTSSDFARVRCRVKPASSRIPRPVSDGYNYSSVGFATK